MSCTCKPFGKIANISNVKNYLSGDPDKKEANDDCWNWGVEEEANKDGTWLGRTALSLSPSADILAVANSRSLLIFAAKWDSQEEGENKLKYRLKYQGDPCKEPTETVTSVICLPIAANGRLSSSHYSPDWTAVAVGFSSGAVRFYTEDGCLLVDDKFHVGGVRSLKCQTLIHSGSDVQDEFHVFYRSTVCLLPGLALTSSLTATRNQLTKVLARAAEARWDGPRLEATKWEMTEQALVADAQVLGKRCPSVLQHLITSSTEGGLLAHYSPTPVARFDVIAVGSRPFVAFHSIRESATAAPVLADMAKHVASKLIQMTSIGQAIPGWLSGGKRDSKPDSKEKTSLEPADNMACRFGLADIDRKGERMVCCPYGELAAVSDSFGRVTLIDTSRGIALRMWKGYRDAECAFIPVLEEKGERRRALFLAIYAPRKGIIQVWALQYGPLIATFPASKNGRLHYSRYGLLNLPSISFKGTNLSQFPCVFLSENGTLFSISVPFHIVLSVMNDEKARDNHLLRQIRKVVESDRDPAEAVELLHQVGSIECLKHLIDFIVRFKRLTPDVLRSLLDAIQDKIKNKGLEEGEESKGATATIEEEMLRSCSNLNKLLVLFEFFYSLKEQPPEYSAVVSQLPSTSFEFDRLRTLLRVDEKEAGSLVTSLGQLEETSPRARVRFHETTSTCLHSILSCFHSTHSEIPPLRTDPDKTPQQLYLGELLSEGALYGTCSVDKWRALVEDVISTQDLLHLVLTYWLSKPHLDNIYHQVANFADLIHIICSMTDSKEINFWWPDIRNIIKSSHNIPSALSAVYVMRAITIGVEEKLFDKGDGDWVAITEQSCIWSQMVEQLEAILVLQSALRYRNKSEGCSLVPPIEVTFPQISLATFLTNGPGLVGEVVAQWAGSWGLSVEWICDLSRARLERRSNPESPSTPVEKRALVVQGSAEATEPCLSAHPVTSQEERALSVLECLVEKFPYSLSPDSLASNLSWEYSLAWTRARSAMPYLHQVISSLKAISRHRVQHGLCCLIWSTHLCSTFESCLRLLNKVGKMPKDRLCLQEAGVESSALSHLFSFYVDFLHLFIESSFKAEEAEDGGSVEVESLWSEAESPLSLVKVALGKRCDNRELLSLKLQCSRALGLMTAFGTKYQQPVTSLFGHNSEVLLSTDLLNQMKVKGSGSSELDKPRLLFIKKVMTSIIEQIPQGTMCKDSIKSVGECFKLAQDWWLPSEELRIHQVATLYLFNHDHWAQELVSSVNDKQELGVELLTVAGRRLKGLLSETGGSRIKETMVRLGPSLTLWLQTLEVCEWDTNIKSLKELSMIIVTLIPDSSPDYVTADLLYEALSSL